MPVTFYPHQVSAIEWMLKTENCMRLMPDQPNGGVLAHAMGLGKTTSILGLFEQGGADKISLVVCPKSVLSQWVQEALKVTSFSVDEILVYHGPHRSCTIGDLEGKRMVLTTFDIVRLDHQLGTGVFLHRWDRVVVDEAHHICEQGSKTAKAMRSLRAPNRWCVTGTPFKNNVSDLVALARFIGVGPYNDHNWWRAHSRNTAKVAKWRRTFVNIIGKDALSLPPVVAETTECQQSPFELDVLEQFKTADVALRTPLMEESSDFQMPEGCQQRELLKILRYRQLAIHPLMLTPSEVVRFMVNNPEVGGGCCGCSSDEGLLSSCGKHRLCNSCVQNNLSCPRCLCSGLECDGSWPHSAKTRALWDHVSTYSGKLVIFSQWTTCLDLLSAMFDYYGVNHAVYDGRVNGLEERSEITGHFLGDPDCKVLLTSLAAGGEGLNLIEATGVVLMEPYWNSAVENQAVDRVHRIGQTKPVSVLRLIAKAGGDSVEDWVVSIQRQKDEELRRLLWADEGESLLVVKSEGVLGKTPLPVNAMMGFMTGKRKRRRRV